MSSISSIPPIRPITIKYERLGSRIVSFNYFPSAADNVLKIVFPIYIDFTFFKRYGIQIHSANLIRIIYALTVSSAYNCISTLFDEHDIEVHENYGANVAFIFTKSNLFPVGSAMYITGMC